MGTLADGQQYKSRRGAMPSASTRGRSHKSTRGHSQKCGGTHKCAPDRYNADTGVATVKIDQTAAPIARTVLGGYRVAMYPPTKLVTVYLQACEQIRASRNKQTNKQTKTANYVPLVGS
jgi:hypothetical protein